MATTTTMRQSTGWIADASTFSARLALVRQRMGWNVAEAAKECGLPVPSWRNWERDNREPHRLTTIAKQIAARTGCDYLWLVHGPDRGEDGGGQDANRWLRPLTERVLERRSSRSTGQPIGRSAGGAAVKDSAVQLTQRRPRAVRSPNRAELVDA